MMNKEAKAKGLRTWLEIDKSAIKNNFKMFRALVPKQTKLCAVVKSNAYGHSLVDFSKEIEKCGADWLAVDSAIEGLHLRREGIKLPILILGYTLPARLAESIKSNLHISVSTFESLNAVLDTARKMNAVAKIHVKVDSGMHRQGFMPNDSSRLIKILKKESKYIKVEGLFTHFAAAKNPAFPDRTKKQIAEFSGWIKIFKENGFTPIVHAAATAAAIIFPEAHFDMVRIGIGLYGLWPSLETKSFAEKVEGRKFVLKPIMTWKTIVGEVKILPDGGAIGYDFTETLPKNSKIAVLPVGYWHGYPRVLSSIGKVLIVGKLVKVVGRVAMDMIVVDVTNLKNVKVGDEVILMGKNPPAENLAALSDSSWYEIITRLNPLIQRYYR